MMQDRRNAMQKEGYELLGSFMNHEGILTDIYRPNSNIEPVPPKSTPSESWWDTPEELGTFWGFIKDGVSIGLKLLFEGLFWVVKKTGVLIFLILELTCRTLLLFVVSLLRQFEKSKTRKFEDNYGSKRRTKRSNPVNNDQRTINIFVTNNIEL